MSTGVVLSFDDENGYGFIRTIDGQTLFVHHSAIRMEGFKTLNPGEKVIFELVEGKRGVEAQNVNKYLDDE
ncbi:MAG: cold shock domain-containing protein [Desulfobacteraceae bacterium]|nr:cold shock domain-containing protein [Desulfobacteraceae bacterium]